MQNRNKNLSEKEKDIKREYEKNKYKRTSKEWKLNEYGKNILKKKNIIKNYILLSIVQNMNREILIFVENGIHKRKLHHTKNPT